MDTSLFPPFLVTISAVQNQTGKAQRESRQTHAYAATSLFSSFPWQCCLPQRMEGANTELLWRTNVVILLGPDVGCRGRGKISHCLHSFPLVCTSYKGLIKTVLLLCMFLSWTVKQMIYPSLSHNTISFLYGFCVVQCIYSNCNGDNFSDFKNIIIH